MYLYTFSLKPLGALLTRIPTYAGCTPGGDLYTNLPVQVSATAFGGGATPTDKERADATFAPPAYNAALTFWTEQPQTQPAGLTSQQDNLFQPVTQSAGVAIQVSDLW